MPEALPQDNLDDAFFKAGTSFKGTSFIFLKGDVGCKRTTCETF